MEVKGNEAQGRHRGGVRRKRGANTRADEQEPDEEAYGVGRASKMIGKPISIKDAKRRFGGVARKAVELTSGDLLRVTYRD